MFTFICIVFIKSLQINVNIRLMRTVVFRLPIIENYFSECVWTIRLPRKRIRKSFAKRENVLEVPFLLAANWFLCEILQLENAFDKRTDDGLQAAFNSIFPIVSHNGYARLEFVYYTLGEPLFDIPECQLRGITYAALCARVSVWWFWIRKRLNRR